MTWVNYRAMCDALRARRDALDVAIAAFEKLAAWPPLTGPLAAGERPPPRKRGRKSMGAAERAEVSRRLKAYWAAQRGKTKT